MICREVKLPFDWEGWLLVSQVEHARVSAELARHWIAPSASGVLYDSNPDNDVPSEVLSAIEHHDDGWTRWERSPQIDPALGRPLSYRGEAPLDDTLGIWSASIGAAREHGPLAGRMVAKHFMYLLQGSDSANDKSAQKWLHAMDSNCDHWLVAWHASSERHTTEIAERAVAHLQLFDLLSLWLCCDCPIVGDAQSNADGPLEFKSFSGELGPFRVMPLADAAQVVDEVAIFGRGRITVEPWPFDVDELPLNATGMLLPRLERLKLWHQMTRASSPTTVRWIFVQD